MSQGLCPSCGAAVNLPAGQAETKCQYCETVVTQQQAEAQFAEVKNSKFGGTLLIAETAQEGGSYTEALNYYNKVIEQQPDFADAWLNKGICMVRTSKIGDLKITEAISSWKAAIKFAKYPIAMKRRVATEINNAVSDFYPVLERHYLEFHSLKDSLPEHGNRFCVLESALSFALELSPTATIAKNGVSLCDRFIASIKTAASSDADNAGAKLVFEKDWKGALSSGLTAYSKDKVASELATSLQKTKRKYATVMAQYDSSVAAKLKIEEVKKQFEAASAEGSSKSLAGVGCFLLAILLVILLLVAVWWDYHISNFGEMAGSIILLVLAVIALYYAIKRYNRKQDERDMAWLKGLPACFGVADHRLAFHPTEEEHFHNLVKAALKAGFLHGEIRSEIEKFLKDRKCTAPHVREQLERFDVLVERIRSGSV